MTDQIGNNIHNFSLFKWIEKGLICKQDKLCDCFGSNEKDILDGTNACTGL